MADTAGSDVSDGPVLSLVNKRLRALRKKMNRITQMEESLSQGKSLNKEQEEVFGTKPSITVAIDELEKLRQPLSAAVCDEINLAIQCHQVEIKNLTLEEEQKTPDVNNQVERDQGEKPEFEDLLNLLYFGTMFDVKAPSDTSLSHKNALQQCIEHAKLWLSNSDQPIEPDSNVTYMILVSIVLFGSAVVVFLTGFSLFFIFKLKFYDFADSGLREKLAKIMDSPYFTTLPEMKAPVDVVAAAAGNYGSFRPKWNGWMYSISTSTYRVWKPNLLIQYQIEIKQHKTSLLFRREGFSPVPMRRQNLSAGRLSNEY